MIRARRCAVVLTLLTLLAACDSIWDPPTPPASSAPSASYGTAPMPSQQEVDAALLKPEELPNGPYRTSPMQVGDAAGLNTSLGQCAEWDNKDPQVTGVGVYQGPAAAGPFVAETVTVTSLAAATQMLKDLDRVQTNCAVFGDKMPGGIELEVNITPLTTPKFGEATKAFQLTASVPGVGVALYAHLVVVRVGNVFVQVAFMQLSSPSIEQTSELVDLAVKKAAELLTA